MLRSILALLVVLALGVAGGGAYWQFVEAPARAAAAAKAVGTKAGGGPVSVEIAPIEIAPAEVTVAAVGSLASNESSILRPEVSGRITKIQFEEGSSARRGDILIKLDDDIETAELARAEAAVQLAEANLDRAKELRRTNAGTQRALDEAQAEARRTEAEVDLGKARLAKRWIKTAFDAQIGLRRVSLGDYVSVGQDLVNLEQINPLKVDFRLPELFLTALHEGQRVAVTLDAFPGEEFSGTVYAINPLVDAAGRAVVIRARIDNSEQRLRPGLFARVTLTLAQRLEALWVPEESLIPEGAKQFVFKVVPGGEGEAPVVKRTEVVLGLRLPGKVEIIRGLEATDRVVSGGTQKLRDDVPIAPVAPAGAPQAPAPPGATAPGTDKVAERERVTN